MENKAEFRAKHVAAAKLDPVSMVAYAKRHGISISSLRYWSHSLNCESAAEAAAEAVGVEPLAAGKFIALQIKDAPVAPVPTCCTLELSGIKLTMVSLPAPEWVAALGHAMQGAR